jgi:hypothetical protein
MGYRNLTVSGKTDGFGAQLNCKLSAIAFCICHKGYRYIHRPFTSVSHGFRDEKEVAKCNWLFPHPDNRHGKKIHIRRPFGVDSVFFKPNIYYLPHVLDHIRNIYWSNKERKTLKQIAVHVRRGDIGALKRRKHRDGINRWQSNKYYSELIPRIAIKYPTNIPIAIYSQGKEEEFENIVDEWPDELRDRIVFRLGNYKQIFPKNFVGMIDAFQEMTASEVFVQSRSSLSYCCGLLNSNDVWMENGSTGKRHLSYRYALHHWKRF